MSDEAAPVKALIDKLFQVFNACDAKAFASLFAEDAAFYNVFGECANGRNAVEGFHAPLFTEPRQPGVPSFVNARLEMVEQTIRLLRPDVATIDVKWRQTGAIAPNGQPWGTRLGLMNCVLTKENDSWTIAVFHNMDLPPNPPTRR